MSADDGVTWTHVDPATKFTNLRGGLGPRTDALYLPHKRATVWSIPYERDSSGQSALRIAVAKNESDIRDGTFHSYVRQPGNFGFTGAHSFGIVRTSYTDDYFFWYANVFDSSSNYVATMIERIDIDRLVAGQQLSSLFLRRNNANSWAMTRTGDRVYWWQHGSTTSGTLFRWLDNSNQIQVNAISGTRAWSSTRLSQRTPDNVDWMRFLDHRPIAAWRANGRIGIAWNSGVQAPSRNFPYVRVLEIDETTMNIARESDIWLTTHAVAIAAASSSRAGDLGLTFTLGSTIQYPFMTALLVDDLDGNFSGRTMSLLTSSRNSPSFGSWGTAFSIAPHPRATRTFVASAMRQVGSSASRDQLPHYVHFGRSRELKADITPTDISIPTTTLKHGLQYNATCKIFNRGILTANNVTSGFYLGTNSATSTGDILLISFRTSMAACEEKTVLRTLTIPSAVGSGARYLGVFTDRTGTYREIDETNNTISIPVTTTPSQADLVVSSIVTTPGPKWRAGALQSVQLTIWNRGQGAAEASRAGIYLSSSQTFSNALAWPLFEVDVPALLPNATFTRTIPIRHSYNYTNTSASFYLGAIADLGNRVGESDETNNTNVFTPARGLELYAGSQRRLSFSNPFFAVTTGASSTSEAILSVSSGGRTDMTVVAPQHKKHWYQLAWSLRRDPFQFDFMTQIGITLINTPIFFQWFGQIDDNGFARPRFDLPANVMPLIPEIHTHSLWFTPDLKTVVGFGDNVLRTRFRQ